MIDPFCWSINKFSYKPCWKVEHRYVCIEAIFVGGDWQHNEIHAFVKYFNYFAFVGWHQIFMTWFQSCELERVFKSIQFLNDLFPLKQIDCEAIDFKHAKGTNVINMYAYVIAIGKDFFHGLCKIGCPIGSSFYLSFWNSVTKKHKFVMFELTYPF